MNASKQVVSLRCALQGSCCPGFQLQVELGDSLQGKLGWEHLGDDALLLHIPHCGRILLLDPLSSSAASSRSHSHFSPGGCALQVHGNPPRAGCLEGGVAIGLEEIRQKKGRDRFQTPCPPFLNFLSPKVALSVLFSSCSSFPFGSLLELLAWLTSGHREGRSLAF